MRKLSADGTGLEKKQFPVGLESNCVLKEEII
jgi:hypothetical protein